ncbi:MAG: carbon-nitrogen hydrolase family protein [Cycloclasticus sp.]|nr:carbon-nitrogen hydrolase family protein [Cycloclasticus sp.]
MMGDCITVAAIQMVSSDCVDDNLKVANRLIEEAVKEGAELVVLPENFALMAKRSQQLLQMAETIGDGPIQTFLSELSKRLGCWIVAGSLSTQSDEAERVYATCFVYNDVGEQVSYYHKIHLFDADVADNKGRYRESDTFVAGKQVVSVDMPFGLMGLSICYDLRFPELYRELLQQGVSLLVAPSAFTEITGRAHWSLLCRTRAVENTCYLIAANQGGLHSNGRATYGHSMIVDPWGEVLAEMDVREGYILASLKQSKLEEVRANLPAIRHRKLFKDE